MPDPIMLPPEVVEPRPPLSELDLADIAAGEDYPALRPDGSLWWIRSDSEAAWAMSIHAGAEANLEAMCDEYAAMVERLDRWHARRTAEHRRTVDYMAGRLTRYAEEWRRDNPKARRKTIDLPSGELRTTERSATAEIVDKDALLAWAKANRSDLVKTVESVQVSTLRQAGELAKVALETFVRLACGHEATIEGPSTRGEMVACECTEGELVPVEEILGFDHYEVFQVDGSRVPGVEVLPPRVDVKIVTAPLLPGEALPATPLV